MCSDERRRAEGSNRRMVVLDVQRKLEFLADYMNFGRTVTALADGLGIPRRTLADAVRDGGCTRSLHEDLQKAMAANAVRFDPAWREWRDPSPAPGTPRDCRSDTLERFIEKFCKKNALQSPNTSGEEDVVIIINRPYADFTEQEQEKFLQGLDAFLKSGRTLRIKRKEPGSVRLTIGLTEEEFRRLEALREAGKLDELKVVSMEREGKGDRREPAGIEFAHDSHASELFDSYTPRKQLGTRGKIFISYRRGDIPAAALAIREELKLYFGSEKIVTGIDYTLPEQRTEAELAETLDESSVVIAVIGPRWVDLLIERAASGTVDYVREELAEALRRELLILPVTIGDAVPWEMEVMRWKLPEDIRSLRFYTPFVFSWESFRLGLGVLAKMMSETPPSPRERRRGTLWRWAVAASVYAAAMSALIVGSKLWGALVSIAAVGLRAIGAIIRWRGRPE